MAHNANVARLIGRQVAHQCLGSFNPFWFHHWIHEGIAMLFAIDAINKVVFFNVILFTQSKKFIIYIIYHFYIFVIHH